MRIITGLKDPHMRDFLMTIVQSIARGFGFTIGRDIANEAVHVAEERLSDR